MPRNWSQAVKACERHPRKVNGRWCTCRTGWRYRMGFPDPVTGIVSRPKWSESFPTRDAADANQRRVRQQIADGGYVQDQGMTLAQYLPTWLDGKRRAGRKGTTVDGYAGVIENHLIPHLGKHRLGRLRPDHVQAMLDAIGRQPALGRKPRPDPRTKELIQPDPVSAGTLLNIRATLRTALFDAMRQQLVPRNVATLVTMPTPRRARPFALQSDRLQTFMQGTRGEPLDSLFFLVAVYGLRRAEVAGLRWDNVDVHKKLIFVRTTLLEVKGDHPCPYCGSRHRRIRFDTPKSAAGERIYPLVPSVAAALAEQRARQQEETDLYGDDYSDHGMVFAKPDGTPWRPDWISSEFSRIMRASGAADGLPRIPSLKSLRSTMVTNLHEAGTPLEVISGITGHSGGEVTREHYLYVNAERTRAEFTMLADALGSTWSKRSDQDSDQQPVESPDQEGGEAMN